MIQSHCYNWPAYKFLKIFCLEKHFVLFHNINFISNLIIQYLQKTYRRFGTKYLSVLNNKDLRCHLRQNDFLGILSSWAQHYLSHDALAPGWKSSKTFFSNLWPITTFNFTLWVNDWLLTFYKNLKKINKHLWALRYKTIQ